MQERRQGPLKAGEACWMTLEFPWIPRTPQSGNVLFFFFNPEVERLCGQCHHHSAVVRTVPDPVAGALGSTQGTVEWVLGSPSPTLGSPLPGSVCPSRRKERES